MRTRALRKFGHAAVVGKTTGENFVICEKYRTKGNFK
jgi:hypothetical protein